MEESIQQNAAKPELSKLVAKVGDLATLPQILQSILEITADHKADAADLQNILRADPVISSKILRVANSAYYGLREPVRTVKAAIVFLGFKAVKNLAVAASICDMFKTQDEIDGFSREKLWKHSVIVAVCAKSIASRAGMRDGEDVFTAAIMHDIGIIVEDQYLHEDFQRILREPALKAMELPVAEREVFGFDHAVLGERVAVSWKIPEEICKIIAAHHTPRSASDGSQTMAAIVYLADVICNAQKIGFIVTSAIDTDDLNFALKTIGFTKDDIAVIMDDMPLEIEKAREFFVI